MFEQSSDYISRSITTHGQMRRLPHQGARHGTVDHGHASDGVFFSTCGCFLRVGQSSSGDLPPLSSLWMASRCEWLSSANGVASRDLGLKILRVQWGGKRTDPRSGSGRPAQAHLGRFSRPFSPVGPRVIMYCAPSICIILMMSSSRPRWRFSLHEVRFLCFNPRGCSFVALRSSPTIVSDFIKLMNTNKTP
jgi:hypothetical protein